MPSSAAVILSGFHIQSSDEGRRCSVEIINWQERDLSLKGATLRYWDAGLGYSPEKGCVVAFPDYTIHAKESVRVFLGQASGSTEGIELGSEALGWSLEMPSVIELRNEWDRSIVHASYWTHYSLSLILQLLPQEALE